MIVHQVAFFHEKDLQTLFLGGGVETKKLAQKARSDLYLQVRKETIHQDG